MKSNQRNPIWPYLLVLGVLFFLSVTAPRGWQRDLAARRATKPDAAQLPRKREPANQAVILHAQPFERDDHSTAPPDSAIHPQALGDNSLFHGASANAASPPETESPSAEPIGADIRPSPPIAHDARKRPESSSTHEPAGDDDTAPDYANWPVPHALLDHLDALKQQRPWRKWILDVKEQLAHLTQLPIEDPASAGVLRALRLLADEPPELSNPSASLKRQFESARLGLLRRLDLWEKVDPHSLRRLVSADNAEPDEPMRRAVANTSALTHTSPVGETWRNYLMLTTLESLAGDVGEQAASERRRVAMLTLARMADVRLSAQQRQFLAEDALVALRRRVRLWASQRMEICELLHKVEEFEATRLASDSRTLAEQIVLLNASSHPAEQRLGRQLEHQYRNANLRLVASRELLNRLLPQPDAATEWVNEVVVGVPSRGYSTTRTQLSVQLFPDPRMIRLGIEASGVVDSQTSSTSGPVTFLSQGESTYLVGKQIVVDSGGMRVGRAIAQADNQTRLSGMETDFDSVPLIRNLIRGYALSQHDDRQDEARLEVEAKVAERAGQRFDAEVNERLAKVESDLRLRLLAPLHSLQLDPAPLQLSTTDERITARLRLAAPHQLGAHTPRPLAMSDSLASLQLHESALNNALDQFQLAGRTFTLHELYRWIGDRLGKRDVAIPDDLPENVTLTFADEDPVRVRCQNGRVELCLAMAEIDQGTRAWYDFEVTVYYRPQINGLSLEFARDGTIDLGGEGHEGRTEVILRGIFAKTFSQKRKLKFAPKIDPSNRALAGLHFSTALIDNGWISITVADQTRSVAERRALNR